MANRSCDGCRYLRVPVPVKLFSPEDLQNPEVQKVDHEVYELQRQRRLDEGQRIANRYVFEYEPHNFAWCAGYTDTINKYFTVRDAQRFRGELLRGKAEGARKCFDDVVAPRQALKRLADAGDREAAEQLDAILGNRTNPDRSSTYFVPAIYVNDDGGCENWKKKEDKA